MLSIGRLDHRILALSAAALLVLLALAAKSILNLRNLEAAAEHHMRDARHGVLYSQFDLSLVRAAGETVSFGLSGRAGYADEAEAALAAGYAAVQAFDTGLRSPADDVFDAEHRGFVMRYRDLLGMVAQGLRLARARDPAAALDPIARDKLMDAIYAYEPLAEALRPAVIRHREHEYGVNEQALRHAAAQTMYATLATLVVFAMFIFLLYASSRRQVVQPINRLATAAAAVAAGDRKQRVVVGGPAEIRGLQTAFNKMVIDLRSRENDLRASEQHLRTALAMREQLDRDLHDDVLQSIYAAGLTLESAQRGLGPDCAKVKARLGEANERLNGVMRNIRLYISQPSARLNSGAEVVSALHALAEGARSNEGIQVDVNIDPQAMPQMKEEHAHHLLQIAREAISNIQKHAAARSAHIDLQPHGDRTRLTIGDDGCGFDARTLRTDGHGLRNIVARADLMGGRLEIDSSVGSGTRIVLELPLAQQH